MLTKVKMSLRISSDTLNDDISINIDAALLDMNRVGIKTTDAKKEDGATYDALILACVILYCKWIYNYIDKGEEWHTAYERLRDTMARCGDYR